jgi:hypothetical protein
METLSEFFINTGVPWGYLPKPGPAASDISITETWDDSDQQSRTRGAGPSTATTSSKVKTTQAPAPPHRKIAQADLRAWLGDARGKSVPTLCLVWAKPQVALPQPWPLDLGEEQLESVMRSFHVSRAFRYSLTAPASSGIVKADNGEIVGMQAYFSSLPDLFAVAWSHNSSLGTTEGICYARSQIMSDMQRFLTCQKTLIGHPMALALAVAAALSNYIRHDIVVVHRDILEVEQGTRFSPWAQTTLETSPKVNHGVLSVKMSACSISLAFSIRNAKVLYSLLDLISEHSSKKPFIAAVAQEVTAAPKTPCQNPPRDIQECMGMLKKRQAVDENEAEMLLHRAQTQFTVVCSEQVLPSQ